MLKVGETVKTKQKKLSKVQQYTDLFGYKCIDFIRRGKSSLNYSGDMWTLYVNEDI
jgi:hypothetical protein